MIPVELLIAKGATYRRVASRDIILNEGALASFYYQLTAGRIRWCNITCNGREVLHKIIEPGESFGECALFDSQPYAASAVADTSCTMLRLCKDKFMEILEESPHLHLSFTKSLVADLRFKYFLTNLLANHKPEHTISELINYFNKQGKLICRDCNQLLLTRQQLANITGMRVETIIRVIKQMAREDKLSILRGKVFVPPDGM